VPVFVCGPRDYAPKEYINTTSVSKTWSKELSPFFLGPVKLYSYFYSYNMENAWQYSKVYSQYAGRNNYPMPEYFAWATSGWADKKAHRYPMGLKGVKPLYSFWDGEQFTYVEARKRIYAPLYHKLVVKTDAYKKLQDMYSAGEEIWLWDFDGYNHQQIGMSYGEVINSQERKMGHAFIIAMSLENQLVWNN
jgi:hypothetical protein